MAIQDFYEAFSFTPQGQPTLLLAGVLESTDDELGARLASFEYLKRDGAEVEAMGASQARFTFRVVLMGSAPLTPGGAPLSAGARYQQLVQAQRTQPRGLLVHPRLGRWKAGWTKCHGHEEPRRAVDTVELTVEFVEDQTDAAISAEQPTPHSRAGSMVNAYSILVAAVALRFGSSSNPLFTAVINATNALAQVASAYATAALETAQGLTVDPSLDSQLGAVESAANAVLSTLPATLPQTLEPDVSLTPYRHQAYMTLALAQLLYEAVQQQKPVLITYVVPTAMSLDQVLLAVYVSDASNHFSEALSLNPTLETPLWIPQGTELQLVAPQVVQ